MLFSEAGEDWRCKQYLGGAQAAMTGPYKPVLFRQLAIPIIFVLPVWKAAAALARIRFNGNRTVERPSARLQTAKN
ncbi:MAG: hypothetical protein V4724_09335 [Pseudomonadota bacterium]